MPAQRPGGNLHLTIRYLLTLGLLGGLALANYLILRAQIETNRALAVIVANSSRQRSLLQQSALLAQKLVSIPDRGERDLARREMLATIVPLEDTHHELIRSVPGGDEPPAAVKAIYFDAPWLLDSEMRNYIAQVRSLAKAPDEDLNWGSPHVRYIDQAAMSGHMVEALSEVVTAYQRRSNEKVAYLQNLALWSFGSTIVVLALSGLFVFRPMVHRVQTDMHALARLNDTLEIRVAQRTADAERKAQELALSEAALRDQSHILSSILDNMGDGVIVIDPAGQLQLVNPQARQILEMNGDDSSSATFTADWLTERGLSFVLADGQSPYPLDAFPVIRAVNGEEVDRDEVCLRHADGARFNWLSITARPLKESDGTIRAGVGVLRDITDKKRAEQVIKKSEALYRSLVDNLPLYVLRKDQQGRFTWVNDNVCSLLGKSQSEIIGSTDADFYPRELAEANRRDDQRVFESGKIVHSIAAHRTPRGKEIHVEVLKTPVRDAQGEIVETQTIFLDVTARIEAERKLLQSERLAAIGQMVAGVAHESRNALQQIQACSGLLQWKMNGADAETEELIADLQKAQDRLRRLFDDLRGYAAPVKLDRRRCDLRDVVQEAWKSLSAAREGREAAIGFQPGDARPFAIVDPLQLEQVFRNMLENALAACSDPVHIDVEFEETRHRGEPAVSLAISDNGPGLTAEQMHKVFEPFFTTKTKGSGLGMAIARRIVEAHDGCISVGGKEDGGALFSILLPRGES